MRIVIQEIPKAKKRPRFSRRGNYVTTYDSQSKEVERTKRLINDELKFNIDSEEKKLVADIYKLTTNIYLEVKLEFYLPIPMTYTQPEKNLCLWDVKKPDSKPDLDNYVKYYLDCMNGILFKDDSQIVKIMCSKKYSLKPHVVININSIQSFMGCKMSDVAVLKSTSPLEIKQLIMSIQRLSSELSEYGEDDEDRMIEHQLDISRAISCFVEDQYDILHRIKKRIDRELKDA